MSENNLPSSSAEGMRASSGSDVVKEHLNKLLQELMTQKNIKHAIIAVESGDGAFNWVGAAGDALPSGPPMQADTPFFIASVTKLYTAAAVMRLVEEGQLALETPMSAYLPESHVTGLHHLNGVDYSHSITLRHLLSHTSGLANYFEDRPKGGQSLSSRLFAEGDMVFGEEDALRLLRELTPHFPPQPLNAKRVRYSDSNYLLLGMILEAVMRQPLEQVFEELLFRPLNLKHTYLFGRSQPLEACHGPATLWVGDQPMNVPQFMSAHSADGGLVATAADTMAFMRALVQNRLFKNPGTYERMQAHWNRFPFPTDQVALRAPSWPIDCGLGIFRFKLPRLLTGFWPMPAVYGHTGSTGSWLFHCPAWDLYLTGTVDQATAGALPYRLVPKVLRALAPLARLQLQRA